MNPLEIYRQCIITKKKYKKSELVRLVRVFGNGVIFDTTMKKQGRSAYFLNDEKIIKKVFHEKKRKMIEHFLQTSLSVTQWEKLCRETKED